MSHLPERPSFEQLQKQAKDLRKAGSAASLAEAQFSIARQYGFETWAQLKRHVESLTFAEPYDRLAHDLIRAYNDGDELALKRLHNAYGVPFSYASVPFAAGKLRTKIHNTLGPISDLDLASARQFIARQQGFLTWDRLIAKPQCYSIDWKERSITPGPSVSSAKDWDTIAAVMREHGLTKVKANGRMTELGLKRLAKADSITRFDLDGSLQLTDDGLAHLATYSNLVDLDISGWKGSLTDRGLEVLGQLPGLRQFKICWQQNVTDKGFVHLKDCPLLETVNLMGTHAGNDAIRALKGNPNLRKVTTGREVTDAGIRYLHEIPAFKTWLGGEVKYGLMGAGCDPNQLVLDGPFTNRGLAELKGLDGLFGLSFFWHCPKFTSEGLAVLRLLPKLGAVGCQDAHCDDEAMKHIASVPDLRMLMAQGAIATDAGFTALSSSRTLEYIWGRDWEHLHDAGFAALAKMPSLRGLAVNLTNVEDLSKLAEFPALTQLTPMNVSDAGFRHVGRCERLEQLHCMYCRSTGDEATSYLESLRNLRTYYAGATQITDKSLEILGRIRSLEKLEFWECLKITDAGVAHLAQLSKLLEIEFGSVPGVTREACERLFQPPVALSYWS